MVTDLEFQPDNQHMPSPENNYPNKDSNRYWWVSYRFGINMRNDDTSNDIGQEATVNEIIVSMHPPVEAICPLSLWNNWWLIFKLVNCSVTVYTAILKPVNLVTYEKATTWSAEGML